MTYRLIASAASVLVLIATGCQGFHDFANICGRPFGVPNHSRFAKIPVDHSVGTQPQEVSKPVSAADALMISPSNSEVQVVGHEQLKNATGVFHVFHGQYRFPTDEPVHSQIQLQVDMNSVQMSEGQLTDQIKGPEMFGVEQFPTAQFISTAIEATGEPDRYTVTGDWTYRGVSRRLRVPATIRTSSGLIELDMAFAVSPDDPNIPEKASNLPLRLTAKLPRG